MGSVRRRFLLLAPMAAAVALLAACWDDDDGDESAGDAGFSAEETLARAADAIAQLKGFHFVLTHENGSTPIVFDLALTTAEGDVVSPDRMRAKLKAKRGPFSVEVRVIAIGDELWVTEPFLGTWQKVGGGVDVGDIFAPDKGIPQLMRRAVGPEAEGSDEIDGVLTRRIRVTVDGAAIRSLAPIARPGAAVPVVLWIGADDLLVRRIVIEGRLTNDEEPDVRRRIDLSRFDEPVEITPP